MSIPPTVQTIISDIDSAKNTINSSIRPSLQNDQSNNHQVAYLSGRLEDIGSILSRLGQNDDYSINLSIREDRLTPRIRPRQQFSQKRQKVMIEQRRIAIAMRLDYESLFIYSNLALDHWARIVGNLNGVPITDFAKLYHQLNGQARPASLDTIFNNHNDAIVWLYYNLRHHRNKFIEHLDRPMQGGSTRSLYSHGFSLFTPAASGSISSEETQLLHNELLNIGSSLVERLPENHWQRARPLGALQLILRNIDSITSYEDQKRVGEIWQILGGETVSYEVLARHLIDLLSSDVSTLSQAQV